MSLPAPTSLGWKAVFFYALLLCAFFAAPYANLFFLLLTFLTILGALGVFWTRRNLKGVTGELEEVAPTPAGVGAAVRTLVGGAPMAAGLELSLEGFGKVVVPGACGRLPPLARGLYRVVRARLVSTWPLGLLETGVDVEAPSEVIVYPVPADLEQETRGPGGASELWGHGADGLLQPSSLREYRPGDELRSVHWKASARRGGLVIKEWEGGAGAGHEIVLDRRTDSDSLERALQLLSALALAAQEQKELLTLHSQGLSATFGPEHRPWRELLAFLAGADALPRGGPAPPPVSPQVARLGATA